MSVKGSVSRRGSRAIGAAVAMTVSAWAVRDAAGANTVSTLKPTANGNWNVASNWTNTPAVSAYPNNGNLGANYDVVITSGTVVANLPITVDRFTLSGGRVSSSNTNTGVINVTQSFTWSGGGLLAPLNIPAGASLVLDTPATKKIILGDINLAGTVTFSTTGAAYNISGGSGRSMLRVLPGGTFNVAAPLDLTFEPADPFGPPQGAYIVNEGLFELPAASALSGWGIYSSGTARLSTSPAVHYFESLGNLAIPANAQVTISQTYGGTIRGTLSVGNGANLTFATTPVYLGDLVATNSGTINIQTNTYIDGPVTLDGAVNFTSSSARVTLQGAGSLRLTGPAQLGSNTSISGSSSASTNNVYAHNLTWTGGAVGRSVLQIAAGGTLAMTANSHYLGDATLLVDGRVEWSGGGIVSQAVNYNRVTINPSGVVRVQPAASVSFYNASISTDTLVTNAGLLHVDGGSLAVERFWRLDNSGTARVDGGTLTINSKSATNSGQITINAGTLVLSSYLGTNASLTNSGQITISAGGSMIVDSISRLNNPGVIRVDGGAMQINSSSWTNTGSIQLRAGASIVFGNASYAQSLSKVKSQIVSGYHGGAWDGAGIRTDPGGAIGFGSATTNMTWQGRTVFQGDILVLQALAGDADLSGSVNFFDLTALAANYGRAGDWMTGDFNYDGQVNFFDLTALAANYGGPVGSVAIPASAPPDFAADLALAFASVPEPSACWAGLSTGLVYLLATRRRAKD